MAAVAATTITSGSESLPRSASTEAVMSAVSPGTGSLPDSAPTSAASAR